LVSLSSDYPEPINIEGITMDFDLNEQQNMLRTSARDFLSKECPKAQLRGLDNGAKRYDELWLKMAELGWLGLIFPEE
jgi:alkylation response protein AidB-like acyl-CoA dehydrogenase